MQDLVKTDEEYDRYLNDINRGHYKAWIKEYPYNLDLIYTDLVDGDYSQQLTTNDIQDFIKHGLDLSISQFNGVEPTTALNSACQFHQIRIMRILIDLNVDVNAVDDGGFTPLESLLLGFNNDYKAQSAQILEGMNLLESAGARLEIHQWIKDNLDIYWKERVRNYSSSDLNLINKIDTLSIIPEQNISPSLSKKGRNLLPSIQLPIQSQMQLPMQLPIQLPMQLPIQSQMQLPMQSQMQLPIQSQMQLPIQSPIIPSIPKTYFPSMQLPQYQQYETLNTLRSYVSKTELINPNAVFQQRIESQPIRSFQSTIEQEALTKENFWSKTVAQIKKTNEWKNLTIPNKNKLKKDEIYAALFL